MENQPTQFDIASYPTKDTIKLVSIALENIIKENEELNKEGKSNTLFHTQTKPSISLHAYFSRILKYCPCSNECFLALLVYFDRMSKRKDGQALHLDSLNVHKLAISGIMNANKLYSDTFYTNTRYSKVGGIPLQQLNAIELEFLVQNDFKLFVSLEELQLSGDRLLTYEIKKDDTYGLATLTRNLSIEKRKHNTNTHMDFDQQA